MVDFKKASIADDIVQAVMAELQGRAGFDDWWDGIDEDIQEEIERELRGKVYRVLRRESTDDREGEE